MKLRDEGDPPVWIPSDLGGETLIKKLFINFKRSTEFITAYYKIVTRYNNMIEC